MRVYLEYLSGALGYYGFWYDYSEELSSSQRSNVTVKALDREETYVFSISPF